MICGIVDNNKNHYCENYTSRFGSSWLLIAVKSRAAVLLKLHSVSSVASWYSVMNTVWWPGLKRVSHVALLCSYSKTFFSHITLMVAGFHLRVTVSSHANTRGLALMQQNGMQPCFIQLVASVGQGLWSALGELFTKKNNHTNYTASFLKSIVIIEAQS